jgi:hypothetical protein
MDTPISSPSNLASMVLDDLLRKYSTLSDRILRQLLVAMHEREIISIDEIYARARGEIDIPDGTIQSNPNVAEAPRGDSSERAMVATLIKQFAATHFSQGEIEDLVNLTRKREEADKLRSVITQSSVSFRQLAEAVKRFCDLPTGETQLMPDEAMGIRVELIRHLISDQLEFIGVAKRHLRIRDFGDLVDFIIGADSRIGRIGGKAAGMLLASKIIAEKKPTVPAEPVEHEARHDVIDPGMAIPESYFLRSDVIEDVISFNKLGEYQNQKYKTPDEIRKEYRLIKSVFRNAEFPSEILEHLSGVLQKIGTHPVIVRSSSLLEDRFGTAFSGKYASIFVANQGPLEKRLRALIGAIAEVYASALGPDPLLYRREHDLLDYQEDMAVLIQKVVGRQYGPYFAPAFAGVAFSRNEYRWSPRINREDGLARIVMGLGTRAVDRIGSEFPRMAALGLPTLRHESNPAEIMRRAQRTLDVINLKKNKLESISLEEFLRHASNIPMLDRILSIRGEGLLLPPSGTYVDPTSTELCITFDKLMAEGEFPSRMKGILQRLESAYGIPVDVEFAHDGEQLYLLQCRTLSQQAEMEDVAIPPNVPEEQIIFTANRFVRSGVVENIEYVVYVDPRDYDTLPDRQTRIALARTVGRLNEKLADRRFILIGPGRWGSNDVRLGVPVTYADINHSKMLIEVARERDGYLPEVSYGTHFFLDLMEHRIGYLPLYPDDRRNRFNETFLSESVNALAALLPKSKAMASVVHVIDVKEVSGGRTLKVVMDGRVDRAMGYLENA